MSNLKTHASLICIVVGAHLASAGAVAQDAVDEAFFEKRIRPVLVERCYGCHSSKAKQIQGGLRLDYRDSMREGGESGPAVTPGKPADSLVLSALRHESFEMPPDRKLPASVAADFERWIIGGAPDPRKGKPQPVAAKPQRADKTFWSFLPVRSPPPPMVKDTAWPRDDVDRFLLAEIERAGLRPNPDAARHVLLRRLYFDLVGLPPTIEQLDAFSADSSDGAVARVVDELLASPEFGERWGRHWLDVVRYAESTGGGRTRIFDEAWRFRDYVIDSFNADKPFDQFTREHLAGDLLPAETLAQSRQQLVATAFMVLGPINYELQDKELLRMEVVEEQIDVTGRAFLAMTVGCARCHEHKFDPIDQSDYYALAGIFRSTKSLTPGNVSGFVQRPLPQTPDQAAAVAAHQAEAKPVQQRIAKLETALKPGAPAGRVRAADLPGITVDDESAELTGQWTSSTSVPGFVGDRYIHDGGAKNGAMWASYRIALPAAGLYDVRVSYTAAANRPSNAPVTVTHRAGELTKRINQRVKPPIDGRFVSVGTFEFQDEALVKIANAGTDGTLIVDAVQLIPDKANKAATAKLAAAKKASTDGKDARKEAGKKEAGKGAADDATASAKEQAARKAQQAEQQAELSKLKRELKALQKKAPPTPPLVMSVQESDDAGDFHICIRGNVHQLGDPVPRGFLKAVAPLLAAPIEPKASGRLQLADWLASAENPLTSRVIVNRVWSHLFGEGIVRTPDNFGSMGERPTHPELLDYLASQFVADGWSMKRLIRRLVLSRTYAQASGATAAKRQGDPENRLLSRMPRQRLDAECLWDAVLATSGELDRTRGGRTLANIKSEFGYAYKGRRRGVYVPVLRNTLHDMFAVFDLPDPNMVTGKRSTSTLPMQALFMLNSQFMLEQSEKLADRLREVEPDEQRRIARAFRLTVGRPPTSREQQLAESFFAGAEQDEKMRRESWVQFCQSLYGSLDFRYLR
ncbi:MAG: DUF1553 domain-containing protein [Pirellulaceae bacterium]|jgi:hypothetical protein|nr:DUF1553 domain-containing protein [Pirellulaceae bacterium]